MDTNHKQKITAAKDVGIKFLAVIGFITLLAIGTWGSVQVARYIPNLASTLTAAAVNLTSRLFPTPTQADNILFTVESGTIISDKLFVLAWENNRNAGIYEFSYVCIDGFYFETKAGELIHCDDPFTFINTDNTLALVPVSLGNRLIDVSVMLAFRADESGADADGTILLAVVNENVTDSRSAFGENDSADSTPEAPQSETTVIGGSARAPIRLFGLPDLSVRILEIGTINRSTGDFVATSTVVRGEKAAVRFEIVNIGTNVSGLWNFHAVLPTTSIPDYEPNELQASLNPGERILYTISFDRLKHATEGLFTIEIDPDSILNEITRTNNRAEIIIGIQKTKN